ncbi:hypothetical protein [Streptomyces griseoruber]|uniref:Secreted protein n=1 Tax=Streptomyces griseoruber TaxID=1943 RepID=A0A101STV4_9ACTN|nr:hypothetical protein [Streptomyces griseoruber]KUN79941.1 hypothetical protein AQJ64_26285 [Streptomyces griseoruber]
MTPLLFLDVDGTLIPFGGPDPYREYGTSSHPLLPRLDPALGPRLLALGCAPVWATTWLDDANELLSPWLGLPPLPVVEWPEGGEAPAVRRGPGLHWKTRALVDRAAGRPFIWLDDEITGVDRAWVRARHPGPALLHRVDHRYGLGEGDLAAVEAWVASITGVAGV